MNCKYCGKELSSKGASHQIYCKENTDRKIVNRSGEKNPMYGKNGSNQYTKAKKENKEIILSDETRIKLSNAKKGKKLTGDHKKKISETMKMVVREKPESYSASNVNGRSKKIFYKNVWLDSQWEYEFAKWCDKENIKWSKPKTGFEYEWNGKRIYYPDFYLKEYDRYVEVKGYERERDQAKWKSVPNLVVIKIDEIKKIKEGTFNLII